MTASKTVDVLDCKTYDDDGEGRGTFEALVSVFGNVDRQGDRVMPGAFTKSLIGWREKGRPIPVVWAHQRSDPYSIIGAAHPDDVTETDVGLQMRAQLDLENPRAQQIYSLMKQGLVNSFSYTYEVKDYRHTKDATELTELALIEAGPCLVGANADTTLLAIKTDVLEEKAGAVLSRANRERLTALKTRIVQINEEIDAILGTDSSEDGGKRGDEPEVDDPHRKTGDEPEVDDPAVLDARELNAKAIRDGFIDAERFTMKL